MLQLEREISEMIEEVSETHGLKLQKQSIICTDINNMIDVTGVDTVSSFSFDWRNTSGEVTYTMKFEAPKNNPFSHLDCAFARNRTKEDFPFNSLYISDDRTIITYTGSIHKDRLTREKLDEVFHFITHPNRFLSYFQKAIKMRNADSDPVSDEDKGIIIGYLRGRPNARLGMIHRDVGMSYKHIFDIVQTLIKEGKVIRTEHDCVDLVESLRDPHIRRIAF